MSSYRDYTLKVVVSDDSWTVYLDDQYMFEVEDSSFDAGSIGLRTYGVIAWFKTLYISGIPTAQPTAALIVQTANPTTSYPTTNQPTQVPTQVPSTNPTVNPTSNPTAQPSLIPTLNPSNIPSSNPTSQPTIVPSNNPTTRPTVQSN